MCPIRDSGSTRAGIVTEHAGLAATHADRGAATPEPVAPRGPELAVIVPTLNEQANVPLLIERLRSRAGRHRVGSGVRRRRLAPTARPTAVRAIAQVDTRVRCVQPHRPARAGERVHRGRAGDLAPILAVMDADLQHDETLLPRDVRRRARRGDRRCHRQPLHGRRQCRRLGRRAGARQRPRDTRQPPDPASRHRRPDERLLRDPARCVRRRGAQPLRPGLQDPARPAGVLAAAAARRASFPTPSAPASSARASSMPWWCGNSSC